MLDSKRSRLPWRFREWRMGMRDSFCQKMVLKALRTFAEAFLQNMHESADNKSEAFEAYELTLRADIHKNSEQFKQRFIRGNFSLTTDE
jgi:hypothetical protein